MTSITNVNDHNLQMFFTNQLLWNIDITLSSEKKKKRYNKMVTVNVFGS